MGKIAWNAKDLVGRVFGRLTVLGKLPSNGKPHEAIWACVCVCGNFTRAKTGKLTGNRTTSCGCFAKEKLIERNSDHGLTNHPLFVRWSNMRGRCYNPNSKSYKSYGGRGIKVCDEWLNDFKSFYSWSIANGWKEELTLERLNVNGNYEPDNCTWVTWADQARNKRTTFKVTLGDELVALQEVMDKYPPVVRRALVYARIRSGWDVMQAITTPSKHIPKSK